MNQKNLEYLQDQVKYTGFGETLADKIKAEIEGGKADFKLDHKTTYGKDEIAAELSFSKSKESDMYFFNSYNVSLQKEGSAEKLSQMVYINNKGSNITLKEAYNLMEGRSVNKDLTSKEDQKYNAWLQLDFKNSDEKGNFKIRHYHENYGYNLEEALSKHTIKELGNTGDRADLIASLEKGNLQSVTFEKDGQETKKFIEASPQYKTINIYDNAMQREDRKKSQNEKQSDGEKQSEGKGKKEGQQAADDDGPDIPRENKRKKKSQSI